MSQNTHTQCSQSKVTSKQKLAVCIGLMPLLDPPSLHHESLNSPKALYVVRGLCKCTVSVKVGGKACATASTKLIPVFRVQKCVNGYSVKDAESLALLP